jgi:hypothetical protein
VWSGGGQTGLTLIRALADAVCEEDKPTVLLHVGDNDPQGELIYNSIAEDVAAFVEHDNPGTSYEPVRLALTIEQIREGEDKLVEEPFKPGKSQSERTKRAAWRARQMALGGTGDFARLEALAPDVLARIMVEAVEGRTDMEALKEVRRAEEADRRALLAQVRRIRAELDGKGS